MGDRLKWCRQRFGWTQRDLAAISGAGLATVRRIEQAGFAPRLDTLVRLAETLQVRAGWLAFGEAPMLDPRHLTEAEQRRVGASANGSDLAEHGPWYRDGDEWAVDRAWVARERSR